MEDGLEGLGRSIGRAGLLVVGVLLSGCVYVAGEREAALAARRPMGVARPGDGSERVAVWPMLAGQRAAGVIPTGRLRTDAVEPRGE